jgi:hypothetical protein
MCNLIDIAKFKIEKKNGLSVFVTWFTSLFRQWTSP